MSPFEFLTVDGEHSGSSRFNPPHFIPHRVFRGGHLQTIVSIRGQRVSGLQPIRHVVNVSDGDAIMLHEDRPVHWQPNDPTVLEELVKALGATPVRHRNWYLCCGKACQEDSIPSNMMHDLLGAVQEEEADILCLICPTCFGQFDHGQFKVAQQFNEELNTPPIYYFQLLAFAQGVPYDELGVERQRFKPEVLRRYEKSPVTGG